jgi:hypothetical protein
LTSDRARRTILVPFAKVEPAMKKTLPALACAAVLASTPAFACDDMRADDGDGGHPHASKAPETAVAAVDRQAPLTVTTKKQQPVKKTAAGKPLPSTNVSMTRN